MLPEEWSVPKMRGQVSLAIALPGLLPFCILLRGFKDLPDDRVLADDPAEHRFPCFFESALDDFRQIDRVDDFYVEFLDIELWNPDAGIGRGIRAFVHRNWLRMRGARTQGLIVGCAFLRIRKHVMRFVQGLSGFMVSAFRVWGRGFH